MAGGHNQRVANNMLQDEAKKSSTGQDRFDAENQSNLAQAKSRSADLYSSMRAGYGKLAGQSGQGGAQYTSGGSPGEQERMRQMSQGGGGDAISMPTGGRAVLTAGGGGGPEPNPPPGKSNLPNEDRNPLMDESLKGYREFADTGGWDPNRRASMDENIRGLKDFGKTGGIDAEGMNRMRGGGVYDEFAKTGGYSEGDKANIRTRANSVIPSMFGSMRDQAQRQASVQGGYGPGQSALMSRLGRNQAGAAADTSLNAELGITSAVNKGRQWGAGSMSEAEQGLQSLKTGNQLQGMRGAADVESGMVNDINRGRMAGIGGIGAQGENDRNAQMQASRSRADIAHQNQMAGIAGSSVSNAQANFEKQFAADQEWRGLSGLESLYSGSGSGEYSQNRNFDMQNRQGYNDRADMASRLKGGNKNWVTDYAAPLISSIRG